MQCGELFLFFVQIVDVSEQRSEFAFAFYCLFLLVRELRLFCLSVGETLLLGLQFFNLFFQCVLILLGGFLVLFSFGKASPRFFQFGFVLFQCVIVVQLQSPLGELVSQFFLPGFRILGGIPCGFGFL